MEKQTMGSFIAALRKAKGWTQQEVADRLNVSNRAVSRWERDECAPDLSLIPALAELLGVTCDELLKGSRIAETPTRYQEEQSDKRQKALLNRALSGFRTMCVIAAALAAVGYICMLGISYGFYRPVIGFAVMALLAAGGVTVAAIGWGRLRAGVEDNELFEQMPPALEQQYRAARPMLAGVLILLGVVVLLSLPLLQSGPYAVWSFPHYFRFAALVLTALAAVYLWSVRFRRDGERGPVFKMGLLQLAGTAAAAALVAACKVMYWYVDRISLTLSIVAVAVWILALVLPPVFLAWKKAGERKLLAGIAVRNVLYSFFAMNICDAWNVGVTIGPDGTRIPYNYTSEWQAAFGVAGLLAAVLLFEILYRLRRKKK